MAIAESDPASVGNVRGPASSTLNALPRYADETGKLLANSGILVDGADNMTGVASLTAVTFTDGTFSVTAGAFTAVASVAVTGTGEIQLRDPDITLSSKTDGHADIDADVAVDINSPTLNAVAVALTGNLAMGGNDITGAGTITGTTITDGTWSTTAGVFTGVAGITMTGDLDMQQNDIVEVGTIHGGALVSDTLRVGAHTAAMVDPDGDGKIIFEDFLTFNGITDFTGTADANFQAIEWSATLDCTGQGLVIPQGLWWNPTIQIDTAQSFGGAATFQDSSLWSEVSAIGGAHGVFDIGSYLGGIRYRVDHVAAGKPPATIYGVSVNPGADAGSGTLTVPLVMGYQTNSPLALKSFLNGEEFRNGVVCTEYVHFRANSGNANALMLEGGSTITTEVGLDLVNISQGATAISIRSDAVGAYMTHMGPVGIGTATVPYAGEGAAKLAIHGAASSVLGPHIQLTNATDNFPILQVLAWSHDDVGVFFNSYYDGAFKSSSAIANYGIYGTGNQLRFQADGSIAQGGAITWITAMQIEADGEIMHSPGAALKTYWRDVNTWAYSPSASILELSAASYVRIGAGTTSHSLGAVGDFLVSNRLEVNAAAFFDGFTYLQSNVYISGATNFGYTVQASWYCNGATSYEASITGINENWVFSVADTPCKMVITSDSNRAKNDSLGDLADPTTLWFALEDVNVSDNRYGYTAHDGDGFVIGSGPTTGAGSVPATIDNYIKFAPRGVDAMTITGTGNVLLAGTGQMQFGSAGIYIHTRVAEMLTSVSVGSHEYYADPDGNHPATTVEYAWHTKDAAGAGTPKMSLLNDGSLIMTGNITMGEDTWIGITGPAERIVFDGTGGLITVTAANLRLDSTNQVQFASASVYIHSRVSETLTYVSVGSHEFYADPDGNHAASTVEYGWYAGSAVGAGTAKMVLLQGGNFGIGVVAPSSLLDVAGDIEVGAANAHYFGDPTTNDTWRQVRDGNDFDIERRVAGAYVTKLQVLGAGGMYVGDGVWTNYAEYTPTGSLVFHGTGGLLCGEINVKDNATPTTLNSTGGKVQFLFFDTDGLSNGTTPAHAQGHITILTAGWYRLTVSLSVVNAAGAAQVIDVSAWKLNGGTEFLNVHSHRSLSPGTDLGSIAMSGLVDLAVNDTIEVWMDTDRALDSDVTVSDCVMHLEMVAGT